MTRRLWHVQTFLEIFWCAYTFSTVAQYIHSWTDLVDFQPFCCQDRDRDNTIFMCQILHSPTFAEPWHNFVAPFSTLQNYCRTLSNYVETVVQYLEQLSSPLEPCVTFWVSWNFVKYYATQWIPIDPCGSQWISYGTFWSLVDSCWSTMEHSRIQPEAHETLGNIVELWWRFITFFLNLLKHFWCVFLVKNLWKLLILSEHFRIFVNCWRILQTLGKLCGVVEGYFVLGKALWCSSSQRSVLCSL